MFWLYSAVGVSFKKYLDNIYKYEGHLQSIIRYEKSTVHDLVVPILTCALFNFIVLFSFHPLPTQVTNGNKLVGCRSLAFSILSYRVHVYKFNEFLIPLIIWTEHA